MMGRGGGYIWERRLFDILAPRGRCLIGWGHLLECGCSQYIRIENGLATAHLPCCCCLFIRTNGKFILFFSANFKLCCCVFCTVTLNTNHIHEKKIVKHNIYKGTRPNIGIGSHRCRSIGHRFFPIPLKVGPDFIGTEWNGIGNGSQVFIGPINKGHQKYLAAQITRHKSKSKSVNVVFYNLIFLIKLMSLNVWTKI